MSSHLPCCLSDRGRYRHVRNLSGGTQAAGPDNEIVNCPRGEQIARRILCIDPKVGWPHHDPAFAQIVAHVSSLGASKVRVSGHGTQPPFTFFGTPPPVEISPPLSSPH